MTDAAVVGRILREYHETGIEPAGIRRLAGSVRGTRVTYHLGSPAGSGLVVRALRTDVPLAGQFGRGTMAATDWLCGRAATLRWLEDRAYPAPRVIRTHSGDLVGLAGVWATLATTYVAGTPLRPYTGQLRLLGEALGQLHALDASTFADETSAVGSGAAVERTLWHPETAIPAALARLEAVQSMVPADQRPLLEQLRAVLLEVQRRTSLLPTAVVHRAGRGNPHRLRDRRARGAAPRSRILPARMPPGRGGARRPAVRPAHPAGRRSHRRGRGRILPVSSA